MNHIDINVVAVLLAAASAFAVGGIWYGPLLGRPWMAAAGLTEADVQTGHMPTIYGMAFVFSLLASLLFGIFLGWIAQATLATAVGLAGAIALGFIIPSLGTNYLFSLKSRRLFFIDAGYWLCFYLAMGIVHGLFLA